ncbi:hypothetical protein EDB89DRAFT_1966484 [Lactarius sanguifluus]|nr:hypothetical protein EDB89DRAFT_1966484 [Lactarius sanguifluus]
MPCPDGPASITFTPFPLYRLLPRPTPMVRGTRCSTCSCPTSCKEQSIFFAFLRVFVYGVTCIATITGHISPPVQSAKRCFSHRFPPPGWHARRPRPPPTVKEPCLVYCPRHPHGLRVRHLYLHARSAKLWGPQYVLRAARSRTPDLRGRRPRGSARGGGASGAHQVTARRRGTKGSGGRGSSTHAARARPGAFGGDAGGARRERARGGG